MATISSIGVGSNLDLAGLLTSLEKAESQPLVALQARAKSYTSKLSAYGTIQSALSALQTAAQKLADPAFFQGVTGTPTVSGILSASATSANAAGNYSITVSKLAQSQSLVAAGQATTTTAIGNGKITLDFGTITGGTLDPATGKYSGAGFTADPAQVAKTITIDSTNNTLGGIRDAINAAAAGVTASIVNDGSGTPNRLVLTSTQTGKVSSMRVAVDGDAALGNLLNHNPALNGGQNLKQTAAAQNAELTVNGIDITSPTNTVKDGIPDGTLNLVQTGTTGLSMKANTTSMKSAINDFVKAYNSLQTTAKTLTTYDTDTKTSAALTGDATLRGVLGGLRTALSAAQTGGANEVKVLNEIGIAFQKDGTLVVDSAKLDKALDTNLSGVSRLFASATDSTGGYGKQIDAIVKQVTGANGSLTIASNGVTSTIKQLDKQYDQVQARVDATVARYRTQFTKLDVTINSMNNTRAYITQQFEAMNANAGR